MILSRSRTRQAASSLRRRGVLLGLTAAQLQRVATLLGLTFPTIFRSPVFAGGAAVEQCTQPSEMVSPNVPRRKRLRLALGSGFGVQYWGETFNVSNLAAAPHGAFIIETAKVGANIADKSREVFFTPEEINKIGQDGRRPVLGYLNLTKIEHYRDYWVDTLGSAKHSGTPVQGDAAWIGPSLGKDGTLARFWTPEWQAILADRVDRLLSQGVDGLFLDDVLQYYAYYTAVSEGRPGFDVPDGPTTAVEFALAMMQLVINVASRARQHGCGALIVVNNGVFIGRDAGEDPLGSLRQETFDCYRSVIDGILVESVFVSDGDTHAIAVLQEEFASIGIPVLTIDFVDAAPKMSSADARAMLGARATSVGFAPYVADDANFNRLYPPIAFDQQNPVLP